MSFVIENGVGNGSKLRVDLKHRAHTGTVSRAERDAAIDDGRFFISNSTLITLTDDVETPIFYMKTTDDRDLYLDLFDMTVGTSTDGVGDTVIKTYGNASETSTIVTEAKPALVGNAVVGSPEAFDGVVYRGETGDTIVGGQNFNNIILKPDDSRFSIFTSAVLPKGNSALFSVTAPTGNTSMKVSLLFYAYYLDSQLPV